MDFNIKQAMAAAQSLNPWSFVLDLEEQGKFPTRAPTVAELARMNQLASLSDEEGYQLIEAVFAGETKPAVRGWALEFILAFIAGYLGYFQRWTAKNSLTIATQIGSAMGTQLKPTP